MRRGIENTGVRSPYNNPMPINPRWSDTLQQFGARIESGVVCNFGDSQAEWQAADAANVLADLSHLTALRFGGEDAESFLQGQLSCDVKAIATGSACLGSYCTPKGRMLASFILLRATDGYLMLLSADIAAAIRKRLSMFVLRSKVSITGIGEEQVLLGLAGPACADALAEILAAAEPAGMQVFDIPVGRKLLVLDMDGAQTAWPLLSRRFTPVGSGVWQWQEILLGLPMITAATQDQLTPQMVNLELIGGVSFNKGCYPGQEIVARTHYLGKVKRRMYRAHLEGNAVPGDALYSEDFGAQASGLVVNAQPAPDGGCDILAVTQQASRENSTVHLKSPDGPVLRFESLPYAIT